MQISLREEFDVLFDRHVVEALAPLGFQTRGKSVYLVDGLENISLIRLGGRLASPGWAVWLLCFRHTLLRDVWEKRPDGFVKDLQSYPFKFSPSVLRRRRTWRWRYRKAGRLFFEVDGVEWKGRDAAEVEHELVELTAFISDRFLPWCRAMTPRRALRQIRFWGKRQWIEKMWIADYREFLRAERVRGR